VYIRDIDTDTRHKRSVCLMLDDDSGCAMFDRCGSKDDEEVGNLTDSEYRTAEYEAERSTDVTQQSKNRIRRLRLDVRVL